MSRCLYQFSREYVAAIVVLGIGLVFPALVCAADVTFTKDVAPILQEKCQSCHSPGTDAPMPLLTYEDARAGAQKIKERVAARQMPPWHLSTGVGIQKFKNDISLTSRQIETILAWVQGGALLGDPVVAPAAPVQRDEGWHIGKPDLIVMMPAEQVVAANSLDLSADYYADSGLTEDRYIKAVEVRVSSNGSRIVSDVMVDVVASGSAAGAPAGAELSKSLGESFLAEYAPGKTGEVFPEGAGRLLKAGSRLRFHMLYHGAGTEIRDRASVGFVFYPKGSVPAHRVADVFLQEIEGIDIPPDSLARSEIYYPVLKPMRLTGFQPQMRLRGKAMCMEAIYAEGRRETLNCVDRFDANWNIMYQYADDIAPLLPAGTTLHLAAIHDNTARNPRNPDPKLWVGWGKRSVDEVTAVHLTAEILTADELKQLDAARKKR
jgi:hypothetical protein